MRNGRAGAYELMVRLENPNELFEARPADVERGRPPEDPGIQQIRDASAARPRGSTVTVTVVLPPDKATSQAESGIKRAVPKELRDFFGNGLFLVVAWVGLWYPLDTLVYGGQPYRNERKLLRAIGRAEIVVRPDDREPARVAAGPAQTPDQSLTGG